MTGDRCSNVKTGPSERQLVLRDSARGDAIIAWAEEAGHDDVVRLLTTNPHEEKAVNATK
jgi:hypothetical protein